MQLPGRIRISTDAGRSWDTVFRHDAFFGSPPVAFHQIEFVGDSTLVIGGTKGTVAISHDLGRTFTFVAVTDTLQARALQMNDDGSGVAVFGAHPLYRIFTTEDSGRTWRRVVLPDTIRIADTLRTLPSARVEFSSASRLGVDSLLLVAASWPDAALLVTTDNGMSWARASRDGDAMMWVEFVDSLYGFLYGGIADFRDKGDRKPSIYRTIDGGATWDLTLVGARVRDVATVDGRKIIATGELNKIYTSLDAGLTWSTDSFPTQGPVTPWCGIADTGSGFVMIAFGDLIRKDVPGSVGMERRHDASVGVNYSEGHITVSHSADARSVDVRLYDLAGGLVSVLQARRTSAGRSIATLSNIGVSGAMVVVVTIDGERAARRLLVPAK